MERNTTNPPVAAFLIGNKCALHSPVWILIRFTTKSINDCKKFFGWITRWIYCFKTIFFSWLSSESSKNRASPSVWPKFRSNFFHDSWLARIFLDWILRWTYYFRDMNVFPILVPIIFRLLSHEFIRYEIWQNIFHVFRMLHIDTWFCVCIFHINFLSKKWKRDEKNNLTIAVSWW